MPQFSIKRLFASVALIAIGCAMLIWTAQIRTMPLIDGRASLRDTTLNFQLLFATCGPCAICAGIGNVFQHAPVGASLDLQQRLRVIVSWGVHDPRSNLAEVYLWRGADWNLRLSRCCISAKRDGYNGYFMKARYCSSS